MLEDRLTCGRVSLIGEEGLLGLAIPLGPHRRCSTLVTMLPDWERDGGPGRSGDGLSSLSGMGGVEPEGPDCGCVLVDCVCVGFWADVDC